MRAARSLHCAVSAAAASNFIRLIYSQLFISSALKILPHEPAAHLHHTVDRGKRAAVDTGTHDVGQSVHLAVVHPVALRQGSECNCRLQQVRCSCSKHRNVLHIKHQRCWH
jgi:hypothetical protein